MIRDVFGDAETAAAYVAALQVLAAVVLCVVGRSDSPPMRHAARGTGCVPVDVVPVLRAPDEWPFDPAEFVPTRPMTFPAARTQPVPFPEPPRPWSWAEPS